MHFVVVALLVYILYCKGRYISCAYWFWCALWRQLSFPSFLRFWIDTHGLLRVCCFTCVTLSVFFSGAGNCCHTDLEVWLLLLLMLSTAHFLEPISCLMVVLPWRCRLSTVLRLVRGRPPSRFGHATVLRMWRGNWLFSISQWWGF